MRAIPWKRAGPSVALALAALLAADRGLAQQPDSAVGDTTGPAARPAEGVVTVDTIIVVEEREGLVWGDWYVSPEVSMLVNRVIERRGQLSGRTWMEAAVPVRDLALGPPRSGRQALSFVDKGVALSFWEASEVEYRWVFEGPSRLRSSGVATLRPGSERAAITVPLPEEPGCDEDRERVGRLDVTYRPRGGSPVPRGSFSVYLYFVEPALGYRIVGVGY